MCERYSNSKDLDDIAKTYQAAGGKGDNFLATWKSLYSIAPTDAAPIGRSHWTAVVSRQASHDR